jgi:hypothetical protein
MSCGGVVLKIHAHVNRVANECQVQRGKQLRRSTSQEKTKARVKHNTRHEKLYDL